MLLIVGIIVVIFSVLVGFMLAGGNILTLLQWSEFLVIGGAAFGSFLIATPMNTIKKVIASIPAAIKGDHFSKADYMELLKSFNELFQVAQRDGLLSIEGHVETPDESEILSKSKKFISNEYLKSFFCDTMKVMLSGGVPPHELDALMDVEIETFEQEHEPVSHSLSTLGDALPGLGIVAAVLGIIVTMGSIDHGAAAVGAHVAAALVGTFLGVLLSYGIVNPIASSVAHLYENKVRYLITIKACIVAYAKGNPPIVAVEIARRTIYSDDRPTFSELENFVRGKSE